MVDEPSKQQTVTPRSPVLSGSVALEAVASVRSREIPPHESLFLSSVITPSPGQLEAVNEKERRTETREIDYPDGGLLAWSVVLGCFTMSCCQMGVGTAWGVFQAEYATVVFPDTPVATISLVNGVFSWCMNATCFSAGRLADRYGYRRMIAISIACTFVSMLISSFANGLGMVFAFQGVIMGVSQGLAMPVYMSLPSQWFLKKRGLASGIALSGSGFGAAVSSLYLRALLARIGWQRTLLCYTFINTVSMTAAFFLLKTRIPAGSAEVRRQWFPKGVKSWTFVSLSLGIFIGVFGFLPPLVYVTSYTQEFVPSITSGSLVAVVPLIMMNLALAFGRIGIGMLADIVGPVNTLTAMMTLGGVTQLAIWMNVRNLGGIIAFSVLFGGSGCIFMSLLSVACAQLFGLQGLATMTGFMVLVNSWGQLSGAPIFGLILRATGNNWKPPIAFSGVMMILGGFFLLAARLSRERRVFARF